MSGTDQPRKRKGKATPPAQLRLPPMLQDYVDDLVKETTYGDSKSEVMRRFIDEGIRQALNEGRIAKRNPADYPPRGDDDGPLQAKIEEPT